MKDFCSPDTEICSPPSTESTNTDKAQSKTSDHIDTVRIDCPKCNGPRAYETNRVSIKEENIPPHAFITRYKCVKCGHSWIVYEKAIS